MHSAVETVRIPGREQQQQSQPQPVARVQRPVTSLQLKQRMEQELRTLLVTRRTIVTDLAVVQRRLDDINMTINATADMISRIDRDNLTQRLNDEAIAAETAPGQG